MKDNFSKQSHLYALFRPGYPQQLYDFLTDVVADKKIAWDCGTGNGQVAAKLSEYFEEVYATDISASQIANAVKKKNIFYSLEKAEKTAFANNQFDLITIAQAIHWFHFERFYKEVKRTLKPNGVIAVFGYNLMRINKEIDAVINDFYINITGPYWDKERKFVDENYANIPFPFDKEIKAPEFKSEYEWALEHLIGYFNTWSAVQHFIAIENENPVEQIIEPLKKLWGNETKRKVTFPVFMRIGRNKN